MKNRPIDVEELKRLQFEMLVKIDKYCNANNIQYSLAYGTLLGAVRHQGYIPWDDDVDIMLLRADYEKFIKGFNASNMDVFYFGKTDNYYLPFAKVVRTDTVMEENVSIKSNMGVYVDIFPIDALPNGQLKRNTLLLCKQFLNAIYQFKVVRLSSHRSYAKNIVLAIGKLFSKLIPMRFLLSCMNRLSRIHENKPSDFCGCIADVDKTSQVVYPATFLASYQMLPFEGYQFKAISSYDAWLRHIYGDYMQLPPLEKQVSHHSFYAYWK